MTNMIITVCNDQRMQHLSSWDAVCNLLCIISQIAKVLNYKFLCDDKSSWSFYRVSSILYIILRVVILHHVLSRAWYCERKSVTHGTWLTRIYFYMQQSWDLVWGHFHQVLLLLFGDKEERIQNGLSFSFYLKALFGTSTYWYLMQEIASGRNHWFE